MASITAIFHELPFQMVRIPKVRCRPNRCGLVLAGCDLLGISASLCASFLLARSFSGPMQTATYFHAWPGCLLLLAAFASLGLYPGIVHNAVLELRRLALALSAGFAAILAFSSRGVEHHGYTALLPIVMGWMLALVLVPILRSLARTLYSDQDWWGFPAVVFYTGEESFRLLQLLKGRPEIGIKPVALLALSTIPVPRQDVPVLDIRHAAALRSAGIDRALIALPDGNSAALLKELESFESLFPSLTMVQPGSSLYSLTVNARDLGGVLTMEVRKNLLCPSRRLAKRLLDLLAVAIIVPITLPVILLIALLVKIDSEGPVFYSHRRIGKGNSTLRVWKIRTMYRNGDLILQRAFEENPALVEEFVRDRKLTNDPRVTRVGRLLRRTSLDELPQLWNVFRGEMSLVGPRPIVDEEASLYGDRFELYCRVRPGLTGLWQVSGRSRLTVHERVNLDSYYVRNWSPWLDVHILARTAWVVATGHGAY